MTVSHNYRHKLNQLFFGSVFMLSITSSVFAQPEIELKQLQRAEFLHPAPMEVLMSDLIMPPGASIPLHIHHGEELVYILEGGTIETDAGDIVEFPAGMSIHFSRGQEHAGFTVIGDQTIKAITIHLVDIGKPLIVPVN